MLPKKMPEDQKPDETQSAKSPARRRHRGRRGGRGRGRKTSAPAAETDVPETEAVSEKKVVTAETSEPAPAPVTGPPPLVERVARLARRTAREPEHQRSAISEALQEVEKIIEELRQVVEQMEEVLELVEVAERQKIADEREIDSLRRALRQLRHPRDRHSGEHESHG